jgi:hypothetical protein
MLLGGIGQLLHGLFQTAPAPGIQLLCVLQQRERQAIQGIHGLRGLFRWQLLAPLRGLQRVLRFLHGGMRPVQGGTHFPAHAPGLLPGLGEVAPELLQALLHRALLGPQLRQVTLAGLAGVPARLLPT